ncbi:MAG: adenylate/guanylate cyclase domain-containing protein [Chloroflexota bacterium]
MADRFGADQIEDRALPDEAKDAARTEEWRGILTGTDPGLIRLRRLWGHVPSSPRCKFCNSPFRGPGRILTTLIMHGQSNQNPLFCNACFSSLGKNAGGAEIEIAVLFADVRGSTGLAEQTTAGAFRSLIQGFYQATSGAIDRNGGLIDKFLGDGVMALFLPVITGENFPARAVQAGRDLLAAARHPRLINGGVRVGVGVHVGEAFVGTIGSGDKLDFSALGDTVNVAARLGSVAGPGELVVSHRAWERAGLPLEDIEQRSIPITGRSTGLDVVVVQEVTA